MREIKFRTWDSIGKEMLFCELKGVSFIWDGVPLNDASKNIMQFTGLKDKNGKEIYEGDIVKVKYSDDTSLSTALYLNFIIEWDNLTCAFFGRQIRNEIYTGGRKDAEFWRKGEVIGNIFENPELIKSKQGENK